jgi:hypothetical protein
MRGNHNCQFVQFMAFFSRILFTILSEAHSESISPLVLSYVTLQKYFSHPSLIIHYLATSTHNKLKLYRDGKYVGNTNSKPPGRIIMIDQSKTGNSSQIIFISHFSLSGA